MNSFYKSAIVLILLYSLFSMPALADERGSEFYNFIQSQFKNLPNSSQRTNSSFSDSNFVIEIGTLHDVEPGSMIDVPVILYIPPWKMWGIDILIEFDPSVLSHIDVIPGTDFFAIDSGCGWEYFAWRQGSSGNCGSSSCPTGTIRVLGIADIGLPWGPPNCFNPGSPSHFADLRFLVTNDNSEKCNLSPVEFIWYDCYDNAISYASPEDSTGFEQLLAYGTQVYSDDSLILRIDSFPSYGGMPNSCFDHQHFDNFRDKITFHNGGIFIQCDSTPVLIGDVNANGVPYEVGDAVLFTNYFLYGQSIFIKSPEDQIASTDINKDRETLKLEDLTQLIRIVLREMHQDSTLDSTLEGSMVINDNLNKEISIITDYVSNIIWLKIEGQVEPINYLGSLALFHTYDGTYTRIGTAKNREVGPGSIKLFSYTGEGVIVEAQAATIEGVEITLRIDDVVTSIEEPDDILPSVFSLHQNYPNPFNIETTIKFDLPRASEVSFEIINILGQLVYNITNRFSGGSHTIYWDGSSNLGQTVGSGVYYYRITAGDFVTSKKMILLK